MDTAQNRPVPQTRLTPLSRPRLEADIVTLDDGLRLEGIDGVCCVVRQASPAVRRSLRAMDGRHALAPLLADLSDDEQFSFRLLLNQLCGAGLLVDAGSPVQTRDVCLVGVGSVAHLCAGQLLRAPGVRLHLLGSAWRGGRSDPVVMLRDRLVRSDARLARRIAVTEPWPGFDERQFDLVIVAPATVQPDRALTAHLIRRSMPFLPVLAHRGWASVGPLVSYHGGACLHCADLTRADADPAWPTVVERLSHEPARPTSGPAHLAASLAATHAAWFLDGVVNPLASTTLEIRGAQPGLARRHWPAHPDCACNWQVLAEEPLPGLGTDRWRQVA